MIYLDDVGLTAVSDIGELHLQSSVHELDPVIRTSSCVVHHTVDCLVHYSVNAHTAINLLYGLDFATIRIGRRLAQPVHYKRSRSKAQR